MKNNINKNGMNKKKALGVLALGGLALSTPFMAYATVMDEDNDDCGKNMSVVQLSDVDHIEFMQAKLDVQISHAYTLIESLDLDDNVDVDRLYEIVVEFAELETTLDELDVNEATKDEMRKIFFEFREDTRGLSNEFKEIIKDSFSDEEKENFREEFDEDKSELRSEYNLPEGEKNKHGGERDHMGSKFTINQIEQIDSNIAEDLENEDITMQEAMGEIKEILDDMSDDERRSLMGEVDAERSRDNNKRNSDGLMNKN